ncbi:hypothetical protein P168DRAFT_284633 [Aspergillus campestris IBT 28561]|uniref:Glycophorin A domain protein n=1 Tax=Aspergillus campestris (strain IBT 28561) TaxID=1392248 RepID=A0A2I1CU00_ASPC2|nr:uncharacterized protein P168DRAFT_284633 [Aspergillus campestris IBT 28561]PKY01089.1 hypothetical protein P168DRAFT_284633 [Aspergillus campestris IBT 28561]
MAYRAAYNSPAGYALRRNGSCLADEEISCGKTWGDFSACCPKGTSCPSKNSKWKNSICCPGGGNCSNMLKKRPHCGNNETWNMFEHKGNFCCEKGQTAFWNRDMDTEGYGCVSGQPDNPQYMVLGPVKQIRDAPETSDSNEISGGAIAGAVVGAVAGVVIIIGLVWFFLRRRRQARARAQPPSSFQDEGRTISPMYSKLDNGQPNELHSEPAKESTRPHEIDSITPRELDGQSIPVEMGDKSPVELPAGVR